MRVCELKSPASYVLEASGAPDACEPWFTIGVGEARGLRALFTLEIREMENRWGSSSAIPGPSGR